jgi:NTE family protein
MRKCKTKKPKIGLALGSGGARGLSLIGVIKALEEEGINIDYIAGSSIGAMVGGFYASGLTVLEIEKIANDTNWRLLFSLVDPHFRQGLISGRKVRKFIEGCVDGIRIEDCAIPLAIAVTDLRTGEAVILKKGELAPAIRASISIPLVFKPVEIENRLLIDGGLSSPIPVETAKKMGADLVIAVDLDRYAPNKEMKPNFYQVAENSLNILRHHLTLGNIKNADLVIKPKTNGTRWHRFLKGKDLILAGEEATQEKMVQLKKMIADFSKGKIKKS